jgi:hypothetical protein
MRKQTAALAVMILAGSIVGAGTAQAGKPSFRIVWDDFRSGFSVNAPDAKWFHFGAGPYVGDDGIVTTSSQGMSVVPTGVNPDTGQPAFVRTIGQEHTSGGLPGGLDHVKWLSYMNHFSSAGYPGFDAQPGQELTCRASVSGQSFGTGRHPFGDAVTNPDDDLRLGSVAMNTIDFETFMVFDFFLTNERLYAFYERLPFGRTAENNYAAFSFMIPIAERDPGDWHDLRISYDRSAGTVRWIVDGEEVYSVDRLGFLIDRSMLTIDHGGVEELVELRQLACGMGMFTLLDGSLPSGTGLVRLSTASDFYFDTVAGFAPQTFVDEDSREGSRLFGQGAQLRVRRYIVSSAATG